MHRFADSLPDAFAARARAAPDRVAVCAGGQQISYGELDRRASCLARELVRRGVGVEDRVGLYLDRGVDMIVGMLAILRSGAAYVPIDPEYPEARRRYIVEDGALPLVVCSAAGAEGAAALGVPWVSTAAGDPDSAAEDGPAALLSRRNLAYVIYTSGSTGLPKGVLVEHGSVLCLLEQTLGRLGCGEDDVWAQAHSISFDFSVWEIWGALLTGARLVVVPPRAARAPQAFGALIDEQQVTVLSQTPTAFSRFSQAYLGGGRRQTPLRLVVFGGEPLPLRSLQPWVSTFGDEQPRLVNMYGITETTVHVTWKPILARDLRAEHSLIGVPITGTEVALLDAGGRPVPTGVPGRLHVSGPGVARGYWNRPELTAERFGMRANAGGEPARWYDSGDLAVRLETGELAYVGRADDQIKISGYRIEPREVERCLEGHPEVAAAAVIAAELGPDAVGLVAFVIPRDPGPGDGTERARLTQSLAENARAELPAYMRPCDYRVVPSFPVTAHGKIDRKALAATTAADADEVREGEASGREAGGPRREAARSG